MVLILLLFCLCTLNVFNVIFIIHCIVYLTQDSIKVIIMRWSDLLYYQNWNFLKHDFLKRANSVQESNMIQDLGHTLFSTIIMKILCFILRLKDLIILYVFLVEVFFSFKYFQYVFMIKLYRFFDCNDQIIY